MLYSAAQMSIMRDKMTHVKESIVAIFLNNSEKYLRLMISAQAESRLDMVERHMDTFKMWEISLEQLSRVHGGNHRYVLKSGTNVWVDILAKTGSSVADKIYWAIKAPRELTDDEVDEVIEKYFPSMGYGISEYVKNQKKEDIFVTGVTSNASCD
jgi:hypothetical protein